MNIRQNALGGASCPAALEKADLLRFQRLGLTLNPSQIHRYRVALAHQRARTLGGFQFCKGPDCFNLIKDKDLPENRHFDCPLCQNDLCVDCGYQHDGENCESFKKKLIGEDAFKKLLHDPKSNIRPCPHCLVPTEKIEACDHMKCKSCQRKWDWKFGKVENGPVHYSRTDGSEPREYRVEGDE